MLQKINHIKRQAGISLLELMLSLAIIAVILTMATRFYSQASQNQNLNNAVSLANGIVAAVHTYRLNVNPAGSPQVADLVRDNQLPAEFNGSNPWGGAMALAWDGQKPSVIFSGIPGDEGTAGSACAALKVRLSQAYPETSCKGGVLTVPFTP